MVRILTAIHDTESRKILPFRMNYCIVRSGGTGAGPLSFVTSPG
jgi:hypothetical protein